MGRIDSIVEIIGIAHAAIFTQHRVLTDAPAATLEARSLAARWAEKQLLDPGGAEALRSQLVAEIDDAEGRLTALLARQEEIAADLRARAA